MKRIAVVEDNPDNRLLVCALLEDLYELAEYETGDEALPQLRVSPPDLVLLDISLPGMDGMEVLEHIRADSTLRELPVIALTAHASQADKEKFMAAGFDDYMSKPIVDMGAFVQMIERHLGKTAKS
jgi:two-component system cell cycle response regulator DivK